MFVIAAALIAGVAWTGMPPPAPTLPGTFAFAALGDSPYYAWEDRRYPFLLRDLDAHDLAFVVHVGDIFYRPCSGARMRRSRDWFNGLRHPVIYTPGDNEWADCWERTTGEFAPLERLTTLRRTFFADPTKSLGARPIALTSQATSESFPEFVEHARWSEGGVVFATVHIVGSDNAMEPFPTRSADDDAASRRRTEAAAAWTRAAFAQARTTGATAVVILFHGDPPFEADAPARRQPFEPFLDSLRDEAERFAGQVLVVHGDNHEYTVDHPFSNRATGRPLERVTRLEVPGSPDVGWVRVVVRPGPNVTFTFESRVVPWWKYW